MSSRRPLSERLVQALWPRPGVLLALLGACILFGFAALPFLRELYDEKETVSAKIRRAQLGKVPYMLVVGDREVEAGAVAVRMRSGEDRGATALDDITAEIVEKAHSRALE